MKRHEFRLEQSCSAQAATVADRAGVPLAEFIRRAVVEKLEREFVLAEHAQLRDQLQPRLMQWLADHLRHLPVVHLQLAPAEAELPRCNG